MRLPDDDEIYDVDATYLGPPGRYIGRFRHKTLIIWPVLFLIGLAMLQRLGGRVSLLTVGLTVIVVSWLTTWIADHTNAERPVKVLAAVLWHETGATRPALRTKRSRRPHVRLRTVAGKAGRPADPPALLRGRRRLRDYA